MVRPANGIVRWANCIKAVCMYRTKSQQKIGSVEVSARCAILQRLELKYGIRRHFSNPYNKDIYKYI